jgi:hypothetical protein
MAWTGLPPPISVDADGPPGHRGEARA